MATITYYVALPFVRADDGALTPEQAVECQSGEQSIRRARAMVGKSAGAEAFRRTGDPTRANFRLPLFSALRRAGRSEQAVTAWSRPLPHAIGGSRAGDRQARGALRQQ
jgi:hypothetical protein